MLLVNEISLSEPVICFLKPKVKLKISRTNFLYKWHKLRLIYFFQVHLKDEYSSTREIHAGLPQGSVLSSILFSIFISDFTIGDNFQKAQFADDSSIIITTKSSNKIIKSMKKVIHSSRIFFHKWKIKINESKTDAIIFPFNKSPKRDPTLELSLGNTITYSASSELSGNYADQSCYLKNILL